MPRFTIKHLLLATALVGVTITVVPPIWAVMLRFPFSKTRISSNTKCARVQIQAFEQQIRLYNMDVASFPLSLQDLREEPCGTKGWQGPYIEKEVPRDPWNRLYRYELKSDGTVVIASAGKDRRFGTRDDIRNR